MHMRGRVRLGIVAVMVVATISLAVSGFAGAAGSSGGNILPAVTTTSPVTGGTLKIVGKRRRRPPRHLLRLLHDHLRDAPHGQPAARVLQGGLHRQGTRARRFPTSPPLHGQPQRPGPTPSTSSRGSMWDTPTGGRQVTSQDEVRGIKRLCNPINGAPPIAYWTENIAGMASYCAAFAEDHGADVTRPRRWPRSTASTRQHHQRAHDAELLDDRLHAAPPVEQLPEHPGHADELARCPSRSTTTCPARSPRKRTSSPTARTRSPRTRRT